jgi:hypothetical protein
MYPLKLFFLYSAHFFSGFLPIYWKFISNLMQQDNLKEPYQIKPNRPSNHKRTIYVSQMRHFKNLKNKQVAHHHRQIQIYVNSILFRDTHTHTHTHTHTYTHTHTLQSNHIKETFTLAQWVWGSSYLLHFLVLAHSGIGHEEVRVILLTIGDFLHSCLIKFCN